MEAKTLLERPDSVLEPDALDALKHFIPSSSPAKAIELFVSNYHGYAQMVNLMHEWLVMTGMTAAAADEIVREQLKALILQSFNAKVADALLNKGVQSAQFLEEMIEHREWRELIYMLSEKHPQSLFLKYAMQRITQSEHKKEIALVSSAASTLSLFATVFAESLSGLMVSSSALDESALSDIKRMSCKTEYSLLYAFLILNDMALQCPQKSLLIGRIREELEKHAIDKGAALQRVCLIANGGDMYQDLASSLAELACTRKLNSIDVGKLHTALSCPKGERPPLSILETFGVIETLLMDSFNPDCAAHLSSVAKNQSLALLAFAAADDDHCQLFSESEEYHTTLEALSSLQNLVHDANEPILIHSKLDLICDVCRLNVGAMAVICWLRHRLLSAEWYATTSCADTNPIYLGILQHIAMQKASHRTSVISLLIAALDLPLPLVESTKLQRHRRAVLDALRFVTIITHSPAMVLSPIERWSQAAEISLVWYFISSLLSEIGPPYSPEFAGSMLQIITSSEKTLNLHQQDNRGLLRAFIESCQSLRGVLSEQHTSLLQVAVGAICVSHT